MSSDSKQVIVFGSTGAIGTHLVNIISKEQPTWQIFAVTRSSTSTKFKDLSNVQIVQGDAENKDQVLKLTADKDIIYSCIGFVKYERKYWAKHWPIVVDNLLEGSLQKTDQKFIFCDNLYAYGATTNISPKTQTVPPSTKSKPAVRSLIRQKFQQRMDTNPSSIAVVGGADFFGPLVTNMSFLGDSFTKAIVEGKPAPIAIGKADVIHDLCYGPDFSNALYLASIHDEALGKFWICPHSIKGKTLNQMAQDIAEIANSKNSKVTVYPGWSIKILSPFMGFMREMIEMLPIWSSDYSVDDSGFCDTFNVTATPYTEALTSYVDFYKSQKA